MKGKIEINDPGDVELTLSITMTLIGWKRLQKQLLTDYPSWVLGSLITNLVSHAEQAFEETVEVEK